MLPRKLTQLASLFAAFLVGVIALLWYLSRPDQPDEFYAAAPTETRPGQLLKAEPFSLDIPSGVKAWRILYTTTNAKDELTLASGIVMVPEGVSTALPVIAWAHGTTGIVAGCAPSIVKPFANVPAVDALLKRGWAYVATDYNGQGTGGGHAYLIGELAARNVLDAVRAAHMMEGLSFDKRTLVWGHSQGGNSALWVGMRAKSYAPDLNLLGVAALAPASDLKALFETVQSGVFGKIVTAYILRSYSTAYQDVAAQNLDSSLGGFILRDIASRCVADKRALFSVAQTFLLPAAGVFDSAPLQGALGQRLIENSPTGQIDAPVLIAQGAADDLVLESVQKKFVQTRCADGQAVDYRVFGGRDHLSLVAPTSALIDQLIQWSVDRFDGKAPVSSCSDLADQ